MVRSNVFISWAARCFSLYFICLAMEQNDVPPVPTHIIELVDNNYMELTVKRLDNFYGKVLLFLFRVSPADEYLKYFGTSYTFFSERFIYVFCKDTIIVCDQFLGTTKYVIWNGLRLIFI
jgi:hypothetical protein